MPAPGPLCPCMTEGGARRAPHACGSGRHLEERGLALDFLERDPPLFFRQPALDALTAVELRARDFQVSTSFGTEPNRSLVRTLRRERERGDAKTR